ARKYWAPGVGTMPKSITSQPADMRPDAAARASIGPLSRVSRASATAPPPKDVPIARPTFSARSAFMSGPTTPRIPFVPKRRVMQDSLGVQVAGERPRLGPIAIVPVRGQASFNEAREHLPLERDRAAVLDEIEHHRLEHVTPRVDEVARCLRPRGLLHEPSDSVLIDGDDPERGRIVDRPQRDRADSAALLVRLDEAVQFDRVDHVSVVDRERPVNVPPGVL